MVVVVDAEAEVFVGPLMYLPVDHEADLLVVVVAAEAKVFGQWKHLKNQNPKHPADRT